MTEMMNRAGKTCHNYVLNIPNSIYLRLRFMFLAAFNTSLNFTNSWLIGLFFILDFAFEQKPYKKP